MEKKCFKYVRGKDFHTVNEFWISCLVWWFYKSCLFFWCYDTVLIAVVIGHQSLKKKRKSVWRICVMIALNLQKFVRQNESLMWYHLKMLEFCQNSTDNLILIIVVDFRFNNLMLIFFPKITVRYWNKTAKCYFLVILGKKIDIKLWNRKSTTRVRIRLSQEFRPNSSLFKVVPY